MSDDITGSHAPGEVLEGGRVAVLDPHAVEEGRRAAHARSYVGAVTELSEDGGVSEPVTLQVVAARLSVLEEARTKMLDDLAVLQGKIVGLREIMAASSDNRGSNDD